MTSVEVAALLKARGWSIRVLLLAAVGVLARVIYNIWSKNRDTCCNGLKASGVRRGYGDGGYF